MTTRGFKEKEFEKVGHLMAQVLKNANNEEVLNKTKEEVLLLLQNFPYIV